MRNIFLFLVITFALMLPLFAKPKYYFIQTYDESVQDMSNKSDTSDYSSNNEQNITSNFQATDVLSNEAKAFTKEIEKKYHGYKIFEGDMILSPSQQKQFGKKKKSSLRSYSLGMINQAKVGYQWPNNTIYYTFDESVKEDFKNKIRSALKELSELLKGCVEIEEGISDNYVSISAKKNNKCVSMVGINRMFKNTLNLDPDGCNKKGTIQHEFIHSMGIYHHQARKDRDKYVNIIWDNIKTEPQNMTHNFQIKEDSDTYNLPYDYDSIMHYGESFFSKNDLPTIETKNPANQKRIGKQKAISPGDIKLIKAYYECERESGSGSNETGSTAEGSGTEGSGSGEYEISGSGNEVTTPATATTPAHTPTSAPTTTPSPTTTPVPITSPVPKNAPTSDCVEYDTDYLLNDIVPAYKAQRFISWWDCSELCRTKYAACTYWTFSRTRCLVKTSNDGKRKLNGAISGSRKCGSHLVGCYLYGNCSNNKWDYKQRIKDDYGCQNKNACSDKNACMESAERIHKFCQNTLEQKFYSVFVDTTGMETVYSFPKGSGIGGPGSGGPATSGSGNEGSGIGGPGSGGPAISGSGNEESHPVEPSPEQPQPSPEQDLPPSEQSTAGSKPKWNKTTTTTKPEWTTKPK